MNQPKKKATQFYKKYVRRKKAMTAENVMETVGRIGYRVIRYNPYGASPDNVQLLLKSLSLTAYASGRHGFTYVSSKDRIIFLDMRMGEEETIYILLHELGHILLGHTVSRGIVAYNDVLCEREANEFAQTVLHCPRQKRNRRYAAVFLLIALSAHVTGAYFFRLAPSPVFPQASDKTVYVAKNGEVYHTASCLYIKGHSDIKSMTLTAAKQFGLSPCSYCRPDLRP